MKLAFQHSPAVHIFGHGIVFVFGSKKDYGGGELARPELKEAGNKCVEFRHLTL